jgi:hypothetical protein
MVNILPQFPENKIVFVRNILKFVNRFSEKMKTSEYEREGARGGAVG